jgi:hypothetical protein
VGGSARCFIFRESHTSADPGHSPIHASTNPPHFSLQTPTRTRYQIKCPTGPLWPFFLSSPAPRTFFDAVRQGILLRFRRFRYLGPIRNPGPTRMRLLHLAALAACFFEQLHINMKGAGLRLSSAGSFRG